MASTNTFSWLDYSIFILMLVISAAIGLVFAIKDNKNQTTTNFLLGGRRMSIFPVTLSLLASFLSAILVLGVPAEIFYHGTMYWLISLSNIITIPVACHAFLPVFHDLQLTSAYEYLEKRFSRPVRVIAVIFQILLTLYMGVVLCAPSIALNQVMDIDMLVSILVIGGVCTFYTAMGGLKAVIWADSFQMTIVFVGMVAVVWKGTIEVGGFNVVWETARNGSKLQAANFDTSPYERHTFWTLVIGGFVTSLTIYGSNLVMIQRYLSMETKKKAQITLYLQIPGTIIFTSVLVYAGLVLFARYHDNDPLENCLIDKRNQLIPLLVMDILGQFHGFPGLMVACIFSATLSCRFWVAHDIVGYLAQYFSSIVLQVALSIFGMVGGPLLGLFVCALFIPIINSWGAGIGVICSLAVTSFVAIGSIINRSNNMPGSTCPDNVQNLTNVSTTIPFTTTQIMTDSSTEIDSGISSSISSGLEQLFHLSYLWYSTLAVMTTIVVGLIVSCVTGGTTNNAIDRRLLSPLYLAISDLANVAALEDDDEEQGSNTETNKQSHRDIQMTNKDNGTKQSNGFTISHEWNKK